MKHLGGWSVLLSAVVLLGACARSPIAPSATVNAPVTPPALAPIPQGTRVFASPAPVSASYRLSGWTLASRYLLYPDGTFDVPMAASDYRGRYTERVDGSITFDFFGSSAAGPWQAVGTLSAEQLSIHYNVVMALSDFEDAVYTLSGSAQNSVRL
jgi:hypothetical protein